MVKARGEFTVAPLSDGSDGRGVVSVTTYFLATNLSTGVTTKTSGWGTALQPLTPTKKYLWEYSVTAYDSGSPTTTIPVIKGVYGDKGDDGVSVTSMSEEYYYSTSSTTQTGGVWSTTVPDWVDGKYLWLRIKTVYSNSDIGYTKPMNVTGQKGEAGSQGKDKFLWIKYADDDKGSGMSDSGIDKKYIGVSPNQLSEKESDNPSDYKWSPMYDLGALDDITLADKTEILSGTEIYTDKADDSVVHVDIDGKSYQNAGSGKNLLNYAKDERFANAVTGNGLYFEQDLRRYANGKTYTLSFEAKSTNPDDVLHYSVAQSYGLSAITLRSNVKFTTDYQKYSSSFVFAEGTNARGVWFVNRIANYPNNTGQVFVRNIQLEEGSVATAYEPPAPSPDYPIEIHSLNDFDVVSSTAKRNLFVDSSFHNSYESVSGERIIHYSGNRFWSLYNSATSPLLPSGDYTLSFESMVENTGTSIRVNRKDTSGVTRTISYVPIPNTEGVWRRVEYSFNLTEPSPVGIDIYNDPRQLVSVRRIKLERGSNPTLFSLAPEDIQPDTYTPTIYKTNILLSEPLRSLDDVNDKLFRDSDGLWKVERNVAEKIFDGTESISVYPDVQPDTYAFYYADSGNITGIINGSGFSSHFLRERGDIGRGATHVVNKECYSATVNNLKFSISKNRLSSLNISGIKAWLSQENEKGTPLSVIYKSRGSSIETLPQADQDKLNNIASFKGDNYVYTVFDKSDILAPELHATFKSKAWYRNFKTDSNIVNSQADKFKNAQQEKKVLDERYKELYAHSKLSGSVKTALYNAKIAFNTVFMALEISLHHYILEKTESRLSELEAIYSGGNGYVSAKAILEVALDNAQSNITEGVTDDKTGRNRWIGKKYTWTDTVKIAPKLSHIRGLEPVETVAIDDTKVFTFNDDRYLAHFFTYLYSDKAKTITTTVAHDDSFTLAVNGQEVISTNATIPAPYAVSIPLSKGWNQIDMLLQEGAGGDHITLGHELSTLVDDMSCYLGGGFSASQIRQLSDEIDIRVQKGDVINAINVSTEGIRLEGKKVSIDGKTEFKEDVVMKSGVIQSADGGTRLDLNKNTFTFDKPFTIGKSQVATDKNVKDSIDGIEIGGRNLILNSNVEESNNDYGMKLLIPAEPLIEGETYTITICVTPAKNVTHFVPYVSNGYIDLIKLEPIGLEKQTITGTFTAKYNKDKTPEDFITNANIRIHRFPNNNTVTSNSIFHWAKIEKGNKATDWSPAPEDVDLAISESQKSAEAVAIAKANLAEINAKAHADGVLDKEEKARIAQAKANLNTAMAEAKKKADEAERLAKLYADKQVDGIEIGGRNYFSLSELSAIAPSNDWVVNSYFYEFYLEPDTNYIMSSNVPNDGVRVLYFNENSITKAVHLENSPIVKSDENGYLYVAIPTGRTHTDDILNGIYWVQLEKGNKATDWTPAPEDIDTAISESQKSAEAVAVAKANLAEVNAKAHADGVLDKEEKARIAQAQTNLNTAMAEAKKKADEAERLAKAYAKTQSDNMLAQAKADATAKAEEVRKSAEAVAIAKANLAEVNSKAHADGIVTAEETARINDVKAKLTQALADAKTKADEAERLAKAYADTKANKALADAKLDATAKADEAKRSAEAVAVAKANLAETNAKAHADGKVTAEEKARIAQAQANLNTAMAEAKKKADEAERLAKLHADAKANDALAQAKTDATTKANEAKKSAENLAIAKANLAEVNAKAHADGKVTAEEKARIAQAQTNLNIAVSEAKSKADEAERLAKAYAELQVDNIQIGGRNLLVLNNKESLGSHSPYNTEWSIEGNKVKTSIVKAGLNLTMAHELSMSFSESIEYTTSGYIRVNGAIPSTNIFNGNNINSQKGQVVSFEYDPKTGYFSTTKFGAVNSWFMHANTTLQAGDVLEISSLMVEKGNKATDWTPAPEDIDTAIDNKSDKETTDGLEKALEDLNDVVADIGVDGIREQLVEYQSVLNDVGNDSKNAKDRLEKLLDPANGELNALTVALNELSQRWKTQDGFIQINGDETELSITKGDVSMILGSDGLIFYSGGEAVATINGQYLRIDRGIFAESLHVGRHQWSPLASNRDHFVLSYTTDVRDV